MKTALLIVLGVLVALVLVPAVAFAVDRGVQTGEIMRNVEAEGVELAGLSEEEAMAAVRGYEEQLGASVARFVVDGEEATLTPTTVGLFVDEEDVVAEALQVGRQGNLFDQFVDWIDSWINPVVVAVPVDYDPMALQSVFDEWDRSYVDRPAYEGAVLLNGDRAVPEYPEDGFLIDRAVSEPLVAARIRAGEGPRVELPLLAFSAELSDADIDEAVAVANALVDSPVHLVNLDGPGEKTVLRAELVDALRSEVRTQSPTTLAVWLDPVSLVDSIVEAVPRFETDPVDAEFSFDEETETFTIIPSIDGTTLDLAALPAVIEEAALTDTTAIAPITSGQRPARTTEDLEAMGPITKVSEFTTKHPCCANRVHNIQLMADTIDGTIVWPGETFSINEAVGKRTTAKGYRRDGAIIDGRLECCDSPINIGGGVSQFGTTFYNAVFYGCYEDIDHTPHSIYFSRYPRGREATLGFPAPDVVFGNDSEAIVLIDTSYTPNSITVTFWGNTGDRTCTDEVVGRNPITVTRVITYGDGTIVREPHTWTYRLPKPPEPDPTTTTVPPATTTTAPPGTTTTTTPPATTTTTSTTTTTTTEA
jgi:vancomycin resistance protein YoaR